MTTEESLEIVGLENDDRKDRKKILVALGSPRKNGTGVKIVKTLVSLIEERAKVPVDVEYLFLTAKQIDHCRGCYLCLREHEDNCPLKKDESLELKELFRGSDGFIFISPAYGLAVSSGVKLWLERVFSWLHRPFLFGRPVIVLSNAEVYGMEKVVDYLSEMLETMGMHVTGKISVASPAFVNTEEYKAGVVTEMEKAASAFLHILETGEKPQPGLRDIIRFNRWKTKTKLLHKDLMPYDYEYWDKQGWFEADYFYPTTVPLIKKVLATTLVKIVVARMRRKRIIA